MVEGPQILKIVRATAHFVSPHTAAMIMPLWRQGYDSLTIAHTLALPEYVIANRLAKLRDEGRA